MRVHFLFMVFMDHKKRSSRLLWIIRNLWTLNNMVKSFFCRVNHELRYQHQEFTAEITVDFQETFGNT